MQVSSWPVQLCSTCLVSKCKGLYYVDLDVDSRHEDFIKRPGDILISVVYLRSPFGKIRFTRNLNNSSARNCSKLINCVLQWKSTGRRITFRPLSATKQWLWLFVCPCVCHSGGLWTKASRCNAVFPTAPRTVSAFDPFVYRDPVLILTVSNQSFDIPALSSRYSTLKRYYSQKSWFITISHINLEQHKPDNFLMFHIIIEFKHKMSDRKFRFEQKNSR
jgi:hypothetical protein